MPKSKPNNHDYPKSNPKRKRKGPKYGRSLDNVVDSLIDTVGEILEYRQGVAMGAEPPKGHAFYQVDEQKALIELAKPLIQTAKQAKKIEAETVQDIMAMLRSGDITIEEAQGLMAMVKMRTDIEEASMKVALQQKLLDMM